MNYNNATIDHLINDAFKDLANLKLLDFLDDEDEQESFGPQGKKVETYWVKIKAQELAVHMSITIIVIISQFSGYQDRCPMCFPLPSGTFTYFFIIILKRKTILN